jgi:deoxyguanosine kinase
LESITNTVFSRAGVQAYDEYFLTPAREKTVLVIDSNHLDYVHFEEDLRWIENRIRQTLLLPPFQPELPLPIHER